MRFDLCLPGRVLFGTGAIAGLGPEATRLGASTAVIVTSRGMPGRPAFAAAMESLARDGLQTGLFTGVEPDPCLDNIAACVEAITERGGDLVVGIGGGSVMDVAKEAAADTGLPRIMVPTTAGSGSEVTHEAVFKVDGRKRAFVDAGLTPDVAIVDPDLSSTMPARLAASSGIDALAHAVECYQSKRSNPLVRALAYGAYELLRDNLVAAVEDRPGARASMALGSLMAGMAFGNSGTTLGHALSYPISNRGVPHGQAVALCLPGVLEFNRMEQSFAAALKDVVRLTGGHWQPDWDISEMTEEVMADQRHLANNPREVTAGDVRQLFQQIAADFPPGPE